MRTTLRSQARRELAKDLLLIAVGAIIALFLSYSGIIGGIVGLIGNTALSSFVSGVFFTSAFTIAPAAVALGSISLNGDPLTIAIWGAFGAMCGDLILFLYIRDRFDDDLVRSMKPSLARHFMHSLHFGFMKWLAPLVGALIIFSPLPDEMGLTLMGLSKTKVVILAPLSLVTNFLAIYGLVWFAQAI